MPVNNYLLTPAAGVKLRQMAKRPAYPAPKAGAALKALRGARSLQDVVAWALKHGLKLRTEALWHYEQGRYPPPQYLAALAACYAEPIDALVRLYLPATAAKHWSRPVTPADETVSSEGGPMTDAKTRLLHQVHALTDADAEPVLDLIYDYLAARRIHRTRREPRRVASRDD